MGRYLAKINRALKPKTGGFTIVEILIVAPITILAIGALIVVIVSLTGDVLKNRGANTMTFEIQDALNRIEQDIKHSGAFLAETNVNPIVSPQGFDNDTTAFSNVGSNGNMLILNTYATSENPDTNPASIIFNKNQPNTCGDSENENLPLMINIVYFIKDNSLWRRTIMPEQYQTMGCDTPWQQPSCAPGITGDMCKIQDTKLVEGIEDATSDFVIEYYESTESTTPVEDATNQEESASSRQSALAQASIARVSINSKRVFAGSEVSRSGEITGASKNNNTLKSLGRTAPIITSHPSEQVVAKGANVVFSASATGSDPSVRWQISQDKGETWYPIPGATSSSLSLNNVSMSLDGNRYRAVFYNELASSVSESAGLYIYDTSWNTLSLQNSWTDYGSPYSTAKYRKTSDGVVIVQGLIKRSAAPAAYSTIANLPAGYRPTGGALVFLNATNSTGYGYIDIQPNGNIRYINGGHGWNSLDAIMFMPDNGRYERTEVTNWANGWNNYNHTYGSTDYDPATYTVSDNGRVHLNGLLGGSTFTSGTHMFILPQELRPSTHLFVIGKTSGWAEYGISVDSVKTQGGGNNYLSIQNIYYPASYSGWNNLTGGSWVYHGNYSTPRYTKAPDGLVTLTGIMNGGSYTYGAVMKTLPAGYRPDSRLLIYVVSNSSFTRLDIEANGNILYMGNSSSGWVSLDGISFYAG